MVELDCPGNQAFHRQRQKVNVEFDPEKFVEALFD